MDYPQFWQLVDSARGQPDPADRLAELLKEFTRDEIIRFRLLYDDLMHTANKVDLWGAAHTINGGCSDDEFFYFRDALIELGREVFEWAVRDPDSLADIAESGSRMQGSASIESAPIAAWMAKTSSTEQAFYEAVDSVDARSDRGDAEEGEWWDFADKAEVRHRLPRLAAKFLRDEEE
jgi:Protein of unknown function (DUF4240)